VIKPPPRKIPPTYLLLDHPSNISPKKGNLKNIEPNTYSAMHLVGACTHDHRQGEGGVGVGLSVEVCVLVVEGADVG
jgi:hypothetical protein